MYKRIRDNFLRTGPSVRYISSVGIGTYICITPIHPAEGPILSVHKTLCLHSFCSTPRISVCDSLHSPAKVRCPSCTQESVPSFASVPRQSLLKRFIFSAELLSLNRGASP